MSTIPSEQKEQPERPEFEMDDSSSSGYSSEDDAEDDTDYGDDGDDFEDDLFPEDGLRFTGVPEDLCGADKPRIMTVVLPAGQPLAFYAQVEAFHRRSILPHVQIVVDKTRASGGGASPKIGLYHVFRDDLVRRGAREGALRRWLPPDVDFREKQAQNEQSEEDIDEGMNAYMRGTTEGYASPEEFASSGEDEDEDNEGDLLASASSTEKTELAARLPGTSLGYWAASPAGASTWMF